MRFINKSLLSNLGEENMRIIPKSVLRGTSIKESFLTYSFCFEIKVPILLHALASMTSSAFSCDKGRVAETKAGI